VKQISLFVRHRMECAVFSVHSRSSYTISCREACSKTCNNMYSSPRLGQSGTKRGVNETKFHNTLQLH